MKSNCIQKVLVLLLLLLFVTGCNRPQPMEKNQPIEQTATVKLYFATAGNERLQAEERPIKFSNDLEKYQRVIEELIKGPATQGLQQTVNPDTKLYGIIKQNDSLIVDFNQAYNRFGGSVAEIVARLSVVNSLTQFPEINKVKILVEGEELIGPSGQPFGFMTEAKLDEDNTPGQAATNKQQLVTRRVVLYFGDQNAEYVVPELRELKVPEDINQADFIRRILDELIRGPQLPGLKRTIPPEVKVQRVLVNGNLVTVDFSQEMHTKHWGGAAGEAMTLNSIVNTLTELPDISCVLLTVDGKPLAIEHVVVEEPLQRNEAAIKR